MPYAKMIYVFGFLSICQSASLPERQFCQSASFARAPVLPECQFIKVLVSFARAPVCESASLARAPVLPERQFRQSASFARAPVY
jgi:hypothetical protein